MNQTNKEEKDQYIYHYTSLEAFQTILKSYRDSKDKGNIVFWASNILYMNDPSEMMIGYKSLMEYLPSIEDDVQKNKRLSNLSENYHILGLSDEETQDLFCKNSFIKETCPFILSFSSEAYSIPMWHIYGRGGHGICIHFKKDELEKSLNSTDGILIPIDYTEELKKNELFKSLSTDIKECYDRYLHNIEGMKSDCGYLIEKITAIKEMCTILSPYLKNHLFAFENEIRYIMHTIDNSLIKYRYSRKRTLIPYIEVPIPVNSISGIEIGPCSDLFSQRENLQEDLNITFPHHTIKVIHSNIPLRDI